MNRRIVQASLLAVSAALAHGGVQADAPAMPLKSGPGQALVQGHCNTCHSTDYIVMNSRFMDEAKWTAVVEKMVKAFGAPIDADNQKMIVRYLTDQYGVAAQGGV
jgi:hypothetical protein